MRWLLRRRRAELCEPRVRANPEFMELETAKEILAEIFLIRPADVEEMIQRRLEERDLPEEMDVWPEKSEVKLWASNLLPR